MSAYQQAVQDAAQILNEHELCDQCLGRLFSRRLGLSSNKRLGKRLNGGRISRCYICRGLFGGLNSLVRTMQDASLGFSFSTFSVGAILKPSIVDRDDLIRSKYRLVGVDGIKTDITRELSRSFARRNKKHADSLDPDVTFVVDSRNSSCQMHSKPLLFCGRYVKHSRGLSQRQRSCPNCLGKGCKSCDLHGISEYDSIEGFVSRLLFAKIGGTTAKFTWVGGEDKTSLVLGSGRPFYVRLQNPRRRSIRPIYAGNDSISVRNLKIAPGPIPQQIRFSSKIRIVISADSRLTLAMLKKMRNLTSTPIMVHERSGRQVAKRIVSVSSERISSNQFSLEIEVEGGLPIKRFVGGDDVAPSVSSILGVSCHVDEFDFMDVTVL